MRPAGAGAAVRMARRAVGAKAEDAVEVKAIRQTQLLAAVPRAVGGRAVVRMQLRDVALDGEARVAVEDAEAAAMATRQSRHGEFDRCLSGREWMICRSSPRF